MIQNYFELKERLRQYNSLSTAGKEFCEGKIQKIFSTSHMICLVIRYPGKTRYLHLGRGGGFEGVWDGDSSPPSALRVQDRYLEYLRKNLRNCRLGVLAIDGIDRIVMVPYSRQNRTSYLLLFYKGRSMYFLNFSRVDENYATLFCSWKRGTNKKLLIAERSEQEILEMLYSTFDEIGRGEIQLGNKSATTTDEIDLYFQKQLKNAQKVVFPKRREKFLRKKIEKILLDMGKTSKWKVIKEKLESNQLDLTDIRELKIEGVKIRFSKDWNEYKKRDMVYQRIKRLRSGEEILRKRLDDTKQEMVQVKEGKGHQTQTAKIVSPVWFSKKSDSRKIQTKHTNDFDEFITDNNIKVAVGKNIHGNDYLRNEWASKNDYWFHVEGYKSSHVIVKCNNSSKEIPQIVEQVGSLLRDYSRLNILEIPLIYTPVKNLKGIKGKPGAVIYKKERHITVKYQADWRQLFHLIEGSN